MAVPTWRPLTCPCRQPASSSLRLTGDFYHTNWPLPLHDVYSPFLSSGATLPDQFLHASQVRDLAGPPPPVLENALENHPPGHPNCQENHVLSVDLCEDFESLTFNLRLKTSGEIRCRT